jgi:tetratricopeptide (TPR) repeat protein
MLDIETIDRKKMKAIKKLYSKVSCLVMTASPSDKNTFRKMLQEFDFNQKAIHCFDGFQDGVNFIEENQPNVIICDNSLDTHSGFDLLHKHLEFQPARHNTVFVIILSENSPAVITRAACEEVDGVVIKPFTYKSLQNIFLNASSRLFDKNEYTQYIEDGKAEILKGSPELAIEPLTKAQELNKRPIQAHVYKGLALEKIGENDKALEEYTKGLKLDPQSYRCLNALLQLNIKCNYAEEAYKNALQLLEEHPLDPSQIPLFIRLSIQNKKYDDITKYSKIFANLEEQDRTISTHIAAGLVVLGKHLFEHDKPDVAFETFQKALTYARGKLSVVKEIFSSLLHMGRVKEAKSILVNNREELEGTDTQKLMEFEMMSKFGNPTKIIQMGQELIDFGIKDPMLYRIYMKNCIELNRDQWFIEDILNKSIEFFPEREEEFKTMYDKAYNS